MVMPEIERLAIVLHDLFLWTVVINGVYSAFGVLLTHISYLWYALPIRNLLI